MNAENLNEVSSHQDISYEQSAVSERLACRRKGKSESNGSVHMRSVVLDSWTLTLMVYFLFTRPVPGTGEGMGPKTVGSHF